MGQTEYKFEKFIEPQFPIYASRQMGRPELVQNHYHGSAEIMCVLEGRIKMLIGTVYRECEKGDIIFIPPSMVHEVFSLTEDAAIQGMVFELSLVEVAALQLDFSELFRRSQGLQYVITSKAEGYAELCGYIKNILDVYGSFSAGSRIQIASNLLLIMARLIRLFSLEESAHDKNYKKLRAVLSYVEKNYTEKIQISELSEIIHVCDDRLIRLFKEVTGETPIEYIMNLRIEAAIKLLSTTDLSVADVAEKVGFRSDTYMTRVFRQKLNTTPGKYRQKHKKD